MELNIKIILMSNSIFIIENGKTFSSFYFYTDFITRVADYYRIHNQEEPISFDFALDAKDDINKYSYYVDPIALPMLVSLAEQLKRYHKNTTLQLQLVNRASTIGLIKFLYSADFFHLVGDNINPIFPIGKDIFQYNHANLGWLNGIDQRAFHKIRGYSLSDNNLKAIIASILIDEEKRDYLISHYTYEVKNHFSELLYENRIIQEQADDFVKILSELITNGVIHSKSNVYALMFSDKYKTKFSISDNGIGLRESLLAKKDTWYYQAHDLYNTLSKYSELKVSAVIKESTLSIFEALYYSMLKNRLGLFDLICKVVIDGDGYFRLHNDNAQIIVSHRMIKELDLLYEFRQDILKLHYQFMYGDIEEAFYRKEIISIASTSKKVFKAFANSIFDKYSEDVRYSSIRFYKVKFKGVHIEVEIPNVSE